MTVVAVASGRSASGATSLTVGLAMAWARWNLHPLLIEADPAGGVLGLRFGLSSRPSLLSFTTDARRSFSADQLDAHAQPIGGAPALIGVTDPLVAHRTVGRAADILGQELSLLPRPVVIDVGRVDATSPALSFLDDRTQVLLTTRATTAEVQAMLFQLRLFRDRDIEPGIVVIGEGPNHADEIAAFAGASLAAVLPYDPRVASVFVGGRYRRRQLNRALLWRSVSALAATCVQNLAVSATAQALPAATGSGQSSESGPATEMVNEVPVDGVVASPSPAPPPPTPPPPPPPPAAERHLSPPPIVPPPPSPAQEAISA